MKKTVDNRLDNRLSEIPRIHREFLQTSVEKLKDDKRILGVAVGGSILSYNMDEYSDLDLIVVVDREKYQEVLRERKKLAERIGPLLESFTGEHVGEPRLLICLYGPPLLHVDLKFMAVNEAGERVEDPLIIWERDNALTESIFQGKVRTPKVDLEWIENRFWVWVHYIATKIGRGELFDVIDGMNFIRARVLGPMIQAKAGKPPQGVRRIEEYGASHLESLKLTNPTHDKPSCLLAINTAINLYRDLRKELNQGKELAPSRVEREAMKYLKEIEQKVTKK
jgi:predicted nucleotidyltransferase